MATFVQIVVNGLSGPRCTLDASTEWTVRQVKHAIQEKIEVPVAWQRLAKDTEKLADEVRVGSLISGDAAETLQLTLLVEEVRPIHFVGMQNGLEQCEPGHLRKTGGAQSSNATAVSSESLVVGEGRGLRFRPGTTDKNFWIGLGSQSSAPADLRGIDYGIWCGSDGRIRVFQRGGMMKCVGGRYTQTAEADLLLHGDRVEFLLDGALQYTSQLRGETELYAMAAFGGVGAEALEIQWL